MKTVSIIVPVYNEVSTVDMAITRVIHIKVPGWKKQIIIVNDGSTDGTTNRLDRWKKECLIIHLPRNVGKGTALREGFAKASGEVILIQDADMEYSPENYQKLLEPFDNDRVAVVYGSRFLGPHLSTLFVYELGNKFVTFMTNILFNTNITDMETGYKVFRSSVLHDIHLCSRRFDFEPEFTAKILKKGYQIYEVPISYYGRKVEEGKKLTWRDGIIALLTLIRYKYLD